MAKAVLTGADLAYVRANYVTLDELCADRAESPREVLRLIEERVLPRPCYTLDDGSWMFPRDYFRLADEAGGAARLREHFAARYGATTETDGVHPHGLESDWEAYLDGTYGVCLHEVTPEPILRKGVLVSSLCELLVLACPEDAEWRRLLREQVDELDALERPFAPDYDRNGRFGRPPTRDLLIEAARHRFADAFAAAAG